MKSEKELYVSIDTIIDLAEVVLQNKIFTLGKKTIKQNRRTACGTKFALPWSILSYHQIRFRIMFILQLNLQLSGQKHLSIS